MAKAAVAYFSASGTTKALAERLAKSIDADVFQIQPAEPYTKEDLDWTNKQSRSSKEHADASIRPAVASVPDLAPYDVVFVGFPVWWYREPNIVDTFMETADLAGKTVVPFATSGMSPIGNSGRNMAALAKDAKVEKGQRFDANASAQELSDWAGRWL